MFTGFQHLHSKICWVVLALIAVTILKDWSAKRSGSGLFASQANLGLCSMIGLHVQLLLSLVLYFMKSWVSMLGSSGLKASTVMRFFTAEPLAGMLIPISSGTMGYSLNKRSNSNQLKSPRLIASVISIASIPWPILPGFEAYG